MPTPKREDVDAITDYFNINAGNPVQCLTQARQPGRKHCQWCMRTERGSRCWHLIKMHLGGSACCQAGRVGKVLPPTTTAVPHVLGCAGVDCMGECMGECTSAPSLHLEPG